MQSIINSLPSSAGIYQYFDKNNKLLYIGKAKNLKNRVKSYWRFTPSFSPNHTLNLRIQKMLHEAITISYIIVDNEEDALVLENSLIKQLKPKYNILLRDDKTYPYICIDESQKFPRFEITRKAIKGKNITYYGPFTSGGKVLLDALYEIYPLVQKKSCLNGKKACLFHQIGKCYAPCENKISSEDYALIVARAKNSIFKRQNLLKAIDAKMILMATTERYEEAATLRDWIETIKSISISSAIDLASNEEFDIFAIGVSEERGVVVKLFMRSGRIISSDFSYFNSSEIYDENDAYKQLLLSFYQADMPNVCKNILLPSEIEDTKEIENTLSKRFGFKINISTPKIGDKLRLTTLATTNAAELLKQKSNISTQPIEEKIASLLELSRTPYRVEIFDNSHHGGDATVGGMVVWSDGVWDKNSYRRYSLEAKDEYAQMREVLGRRIANFGFESPPDLWVLDGGATLLKLAISLLRDAGVNLDVIAISKEKLDAKANRAKGSARDIVYSINEKFNLQPTDKRLQWIQKLRDEAHRYAIAFHRAKKRKVMIQSKLLEEKGVGKALIIKLLNHFGTFEAIDNASLENLSEVVSEKIAYIIKNRTP